MVWHVCLCLRAPDVIRSILEMCCLSHNVSNWIKKINQHVDKYQIQQQSISIHVLYIVSHIYLLQAAIPCGHISAEANTTQIKSNNLLPIIKINEEHQPNKIDTLQQTISSFHLTNRTASINGFCSELS